MKYGLLSWFSYVQIENEYEQVEHYFREKSKSYANWTVNMAFAQNDSLDPFVTLYIIALCNHISMAFHITILFL